MPHLSVTCKKHYTTILFSGQQQNMMQYGNMMHHNMQNPMMNQQMDMTNMHHQMMPGMTMMPNNMMMMNPQMQMTNQNIYFSNGVILPALPGTTTPQRREQPPGCRTIFIGGLPNGVTEDNIKEIFQRFGLIDEVKVHKQGVCHVRYAKPESVEQSFFVSGHRIKFHDQMESEATTLFVDYALVSVSIISSIYKIRYDSRTWIFFFLTFFQLSYGQLEV